MAIVKMKHLRLIAAASVREELVRDLSKLGCVEITSAQEDLLAEHSSLITRSESDSAELRAKLSRVQSAVETLGKYGKIKGGLFASRRRVPEQELFDPQFLSQALAFADEILDAEREIGLNFNEINRLASRRESLVPWQGLDVALDAPSTRSTSVIFATVPASHSFEQMQAEARAASDTAELFHASSDKEQHYFLLICHADARQQLLDALRPFALSLTQVKDVSGSAGENISEIDRQIKALREKGEALRNKISEHAKSVHKLENAADAFTVLLNRELACEQLLQTKSTVILDGWFPERETGALTALLDLYRCAYELRDPTPEEEPPILTYNLKLFAPFGIITNMYSPPAYRGIDPNPFMAPFFAVFFGIMLSDAGYGLLLVLASIIALTKFKLRGTMHQAMILVLICGVSTFIWGALFGGFFGDAIASVYKLVTGETFTVDTALWFNPLNDPMKMLIFSFALGGIHIFAGMAIQAYMLIRDGHVWDAVFDIGFWWLVLAGAVFLILGMVPLGGGLAGAGALGLILTQGRHEKSIIKKFTKGISSLYDITSYLGDILSYSRLLALGLATAVVASVMNTMGVLTGPIGFIFVFLIGHTFNIAINLVGSYVHTARLQYVEFFGKFYQSGGSLFNPLDTRTKYVDIIKEEQ